jgi:hypothetical protein
MKYALIGIVLLILVSAVVMVYQVFFQFNNKRVRALIMDESKNYSDPQSAYKIMHEAVMHVLHNRSLVKQVFSYARATGTEVEQVLVNAAINECKSFGYLA